MVGLFVGWLGVWGEGGGLWELLKVCGWLGGWVYGGLVG